MFKLHDFQTDIINEARIALRTHDSVLIQSPTGSGKTVLSADMSGSASRKKKRTFFICHRAELIDQTAITFDKVGIKYGFVAAGYRPDPFQHVQICSIDTLKSRIDKIEPPDFCIWDECHHLAASGWSKVHGLYSSAKHVGLTATPERLDGKGLGAWFTHMVKGPSPAWLIENGFLSDYKAFTPSAPDLAGVHKRMGDYAKGELADAMDRNTITGDVISHYLRLARGKKAIVFCVNIQHSQHVAEQFKAAGLMAVHVDGKTPKPDRRAAFDGLRNGSIDVICNVDIAGEGVDVPAIEASILLRPTQSMSLHLQQVGRALRVVPGKKHAIILDHAGNLARHGLPDEEREWSLEGNAGKKKGKKDEVEEETIRQCPKCYHVHKPMPMCPGCGHIYVIKERKLEQVDGELVEIDKEAIKRQRKKEQGNAYSLDDLIKLGVQRGYKNPSTWAAHIWTAREAKKRSRA